jgi:hypothetical protein
MKCASPKNALIDHWTITAAYHRRKLANAERELAFAIAEARGDRVTAQDDQQPLRGD